MYKKRKIIFLFSVSFVLLAGCSYLQYSQQLLTLKAVGDSQAQIAKSLKIEEKYFGKLINDVKEGMLKTGMEKSEIINAYGEPLLIKESLIRNVTEIFLYRHPTNFFKSDRVYLYFNNSSILVDWEYKEYKE